MTELERPEGQSDKESNALPERVLWKIRAVSEKVMDASLLEADLIALAQSAYNEGVIAERLRTPSSAGGTITEPMVEAAAQRMVALVMSGIIEKPQLVQWRQWTGSARAILEAALEASTPSSATTSIKDQRDALRWLQERLFYGEVSTGRECDRYARSGIQEVLNNMEGGVTEHPAIVGALRPSDRGGVQK